MSLDSVLSADSAFSALSADSQTIFFRLQSFTMASSSANSSTSTISPVPPFSSLTMDSSHSSMLIIVHCLNGMNFLEWSQSVKLAIDGRGKLGYLTGEVSEPNPSDPSYRVWRSENSLVTAWLLNSMKSPLPSRTCL